MLFSQRFLYLYFTIFTLFCIVLGRFSFAESGYISDDYETQLTAVGDINAQGETMFYFGDYALMSNKYLIPFNSGVEIVNEWIKDGILPMRVDWTTC